VNGVPPHNEEAEASVLGAILLAGGSPQPLGVVTADVRLRPEHFYRPRHAAIFTALFALGERNEPIDVVTACDELEREGKLEEVGGREYVHALPNLVPSVAHVRSYAATVKRTARDRELAEVGMAIAEAAHAGDDEQLARAESRLAKVGEERAERPTREHRFEALLDHVERGELDLPQWPWATLNEMTGGIWPGHLTILGGITRHGKSVILDQVLEHRCRRDPDARVALYPTEMSTLERDLRTVSRNGDLPLKRVLRGKVYESEARKFRRGAESLSFEIVPVGGMNARDIALDVITQRWDLIGIDLLNGLPGSSKTEDIDENVRTLASAAAQSGCHIIATNHLNRARNIGEYPPEPTLADLRGSGQLGDLATNVFFVYRFPRRDAADMPTRHPGSESYLEAAKLKNGIEGRVDLHFDGGRMRFIEAAPELAAAAA
jgi:replicative DNA helicase